MWAVIFANGNLRETTSAEEVRAAHVAGEILWVDLEDRTKEVDVLLTDTFHLHPLTTEDVWTDRESPKVDEFESYLYVLAHAVERTEDGKFGTREVDLILGKNFVITHDGTACTTKPVRAEVMRSPRLLSRGAPWLAHALLDRLVDAYEPIIDGFDDDLETLMERVLAKAGTREGGPVLNSILSTKRGLQSLRRVSIHQRELLLRLARGEFRLIPPEVLPYIRDVHDHFVRVGDLADSYRDLANGALDAYLSVQSNRMNQVMKTLTLISTVMLPITFIAGVYGMNFDNMPELHWRYGYLAALLLMASVAAGVVIFFRRKGWLD